MSPCPGGHLAVDSGKEAVSLGEAWKLPDVIDPYVVRFQVCFCFFSQKDTVQHPSTNSFGASGTVKLDSV